MPQTRALPLNIILLGDPAAGKATQGALLAKKFHLFDFDMGKELRRRRNQDQILHQALQRKTDKGNLTPTAFVRSILRETIDRVPQKKGILFDGHPKMLGEAQLVARLLKKLHRLDPIVIYISIPLDETVKRMRDRRGYFKGKFGKRADDTDEALKNRARYYRKNIAQVVEFFSSHYPYEKISGLGTEQAVQRRILQVIKKFSSNSQGKRPL
jgi:adenylate kinase